MKMIIFVSIFLCFGIKMQAQTNRKTNPPKIKYSWDGKELTKKQFRDTIHIFTLKYVDSVNQTMNYKQKKDSNKTF